MKRLFIALAVFLAIVGIFLWFYDFPQKLNLKLPAEDYHTGDPASAQPTIIRIKGTLHRPLWRPVFFRGSFTIDQYDFTKTDEWIEEGLDYALRKDWDWGTLAYVNWPSGQIRQFGMIRITGRFKTININISESSNKDPKIRDTHRLSAPASSYEEAHAIDEYFKNNPIPK